VRAVSKGGAGSPGRKAQMERVKNKVFVVFLNRHLFIFEQTPQVSKRSFSKNPGF